MKKILIFIIILFLLMLNFVEGKKILSLPEINNPNTIYYPISVNDDVIVITDTFHVFVYSIKNYKLIKKFGKQGAGPTEFLGWDAGFIWTTILDNKIIVTSRGKVSYFNIEGDFLNEHRVDQGNGFVYRPFEDKFAAYSVVREKGKSMGVVNLYDKKFNILKELIRYEEWISQRKFNPYTYRKPIPKVYKNKLYVNDVNNGNIKIFNKDGSLFKLIDFKYEKIKVTKYIQKLTIEAYQTDLRVKFLFRSPAEVIQRLEFPEFFPIMKQYDIVDDKIYVLTYKSDNKKSEFVIFDRFGKYLGKKMIYIPHISLTEQVPFTIKNNFIYYMIDNEKKEEWELHRSRF